MKERNDETNYSALTTQKVFILKILLTRKRKKVELETEKQALLVVVFVLAVEVELLPNVNFT